ncbi:MAG: DUF4340 domain-containing protein [Anaerolineales bacterium]|nr:DUF4340 domain-containing protein [Anaerolineales bacterium]
MFRRSTWIFLAAAILVIGAAIYLNLNPPTPGSEATPAPTSDIAYLFSSSEGIATDITIQDAEANLIQIARDEEGWKIVKPEETEADQGLVEAAATQLNVLRILNTLEITPKEVGLEKPGYTITIGFSSNKEDKLFIGAETPSGGGYYARLNDGGIIIIDRNGIDALKNLLLSPPYLETQVPTPGSG